MYKRVIINIEPKMYEAIRAIAFYENISFSKTIRNLLEPAIREKIKQIKNQRQEKKEEEQLKQEVQQRPQPVQEPQGYFKIM